MFDVKSFKSSPGLARRLIAFSEISSLSFDEGLVNLALEGLISREQLKNFPYDLDDQQISALQFVEDWQGRALLLGDDRQKLRTTALATAFMHGGKLLILAQPDKYYEWARLVKQVWPNAEISVFGNQRYVKKEHTYLYPDAVRFTSEPNYDAEVFITSYGGVIWNNFLGKASFEQTIVEEFEDLGTVRYTWESAVKGMARELPRPIYLQDISVLPSDPNMDILSSLQISTSRTSIHISTLLRDYVRAGVPHKLEPFTGEPKALAEYLRQRGYHNFDFMKLYTIFGVSSHLISNTSPLLFYDDSIRHFRNQKASNKKSSGLDRLVEKSDQMVQTAGRKMPDIVRLALDGNDVMAPLVGQLMDSQWATVKATHIKSFATRFAGQMAKCLHLTSNKDLVRGLKMQISFGLEALVDSYDAESSKARFLGKAGKEFIPLNHLVVNQQQLLDPELLNKANFLIVGDTPTNREEFMDLQDLAKHYDIKLVLPMMLGTWEEEIYQQLI